MQVENLTKEQVDMAGVFFDKMGAPVTHKTFNMEDMNFAKRLTAIEEGIADIKNILNHTFGDHVLVKGEWIDILCKNRKALRKAGFNHTRG
jgi:hypothetical protein